VAVGTVLGGDEADRIVGQPIRDAHIGNRLARLKIVPPFNGVLPHRQLDCETAHFCGNLIMIPLDHENVVAIRTV
jgi:hypothetical protein